MDVIFVHFWGNIRQIALCVEKIVMCFYRRQTEILQLVNFASFAI